MLNPPKSPRSQNCFPRPSGINQWRERTSACIHNCRCRVHAGRAACNAVECAYCRVRRRSPSPRAAYLARKLLPQKVRARAVDF
jgi:hypothetical protein